MQLNQTTDHAIRIILHLSGNDAIVQSHEIADKTNLSRRYMFQITSRLRDAGYISVSKGPQGGYRLRKTPAEISVFDIINTMEGPVQLPSHCASSPLSTSLGAVYSTFKTFFEEYTKLLTFDKLACSTCEEIQLLTRDFVIEKKAGLYT